jgi:hypothetical protein
MYLVKCTNGLTNVEHKVKAYARAKRLAYRYKCLGFHVEIKEVRR